MAEDTKGKAMVEDTRVKVVIEEQGGNHFRIIVQEEVSHCLGPSAGNGMQELAPLVLTADVGMCVRHAQRQESWEKSTRLHPITILVQESREFSHSPTLSAESHLVSWDTKDFISAYQAVKSSERYNFQGCKIPVSTAIRYDRIEEALGEMATPKDVRILELLKYGMPIYCDATAWVTKAPKKPPLCNILQERGW